GLRATGLGHGVPPGPKPKRIRPDLPDGRLDALPGDLVHVDLPRVVIAFALRADHAEVLRERTAPARRRVGRGHVRHLPVVERDGSETNRDGHDLRLVDLAAQEVTLHALDGLVHDHTLLVRARDEVHAAVLHVDVVEGHPARDAALIQVAAPITFVLVPRRARA